MSSKIWLSLTFLLFGAFLLAETPVTLAVDPSQANRETRRQAPPIAALARTAPIIVDHTTTDITAIPQVWIEQAKNTLHIGYGHTSHGSQLTSGMSGLVDFANGGGLGLVLPYNTFSWNRGGAGGALDLREGDGYGDGDLDHDAGYYPAWVNETIDYLGIPDPVTGRGQDNPDINVIIWSWCGQAAGKTETTMRTEYLEPMTQLEQDYPGVTFVYMTGHADGSGETGNLHQRNQQIRQYAIANNKVLFDFYDIELYDPDGTYYGNRYATDGCNYDYNNSGGTTESGDPALPTNGDKNWARDWQSTHTLNTDWYSCGCAHSQSLNCNQKAYAAWWLWARLAGWDGQAGPTLDLHASSADRTLYLTWTVDTTPPATTTWRIDYDGPVGNPPSPITDIISSTRAYSLSDLTNYTRYTVTLRAMLGTTPFLTDTVQAMPTDHLMYLPIILKASAPN